MPSDPLVSRRVALASGENPPCPSRRGAILEPRRQARNSSRHLPGVRTKVRMSRAWAPDMRTFVRTPGKLLTVGRTRWGGSRGVPAAAVLLFPDGTPAHLITCRGGEE